jgi:transcriptional regulator with PAS, ATPase and Fis domain
MSNPLEHVVFEIAQCVWGKSGQSFFGSLVRQLAAALDADLVTVGALKPGGDRVVTLAVDRGGQEAPPFEYDLAGTPCAGVVEKRVCSYASGIQTLFPKDRALVEMGAEGYVGAPLLNSSGECLGLINAVTRRPVENLKLAEALLQIFAVSATAELERKYHEEALERSEERFHSFVDHGTEAIVRFAVDPPVPVDLPEEEKVDQFYLHTYVADCNVQAARLFGMTRAEELIGANLEKLSPRGDPDQMQRLTVAMRAPGPTTQVERPFQGRTLLMTREMIIQDRKVWGAWVTGRDVTELKKAEAQVRQLNTELEHRVEELTNLKSRLEQDNAYLREEIRAEHHLDEMVGASARFRELASRVQLVASTSATVLISGETGTGKELVARAIHNLSPRRERTLVKVNCAAISAGLVESELFGHVKGAFTGASERHIGRFEYADGGTLFLDEVTELPLESQAKLLRVLQEQEFEPVGSNRTVKVDVRLLAATNRSLADAVREGRFRMDLYYRLMVVPVEVPPLRERREDIPALAAHFVARLARQFGRRIDGISESMLRQLLAYDWPGNIRELENLLSRAIVLSPGGVLEAPFFAAGPATPDTVPPRSAALDAGFESLEDAERRHIESVMQSTR